MKRNNSLVRSYDNITNIITDPLNFIGNNLNISLTSPDSDLLTADPALNSKYFSKILTKTDFNEEINNEILGMLASQGLNGIMSRLVDRAVNEQISCMGLTKINCLKSDGSINF